VNAVEEVVREQLYAALGAHGLLLDDGAAAAGMADAATLGGALLPSVVDALYGETLASNPSARVVFDNNATASRVSLALAFGALTAQLVLPPPADLPGDENALCAVFNLGIGLIDGLCDRSPRQGLPLLRALADLDFSTVRGAGDAWIGLHAALPADLLRDPTVDFALRVVDLFFDLLHTTYPSDGEIALRSRVGMLLGDALDAERRSVDRSMRDRDLAELMDCSRLTSVLPFQIIAVLATGADGGLAQAAATALGEAMWRVDDLVDLVEDAASGALNSLLLCDDGRPRIAVVAAAAASYLATGLEVAPGAQAGTSRRAFLACVQSYAGLLTPRSGLPPSSSA
jgi:hypothetical protein